MKNKFFRVWLGYAKSIPINGDELEKAVGAMLSGNVAVFARGIVLGSSITLIEPDWNRILGCSEGYVLGPEDYRNIKSGVRADYENIIRQTTNGVLKLSDRQFLPDKIS